MSVPLLSLPFSESLSGLHSGCMFNKLDVCVPKSVRYAPSDTEIYKENNSRKKIINCIKTDQSNHCQSITMLGGIVHYIQGFKGPVEHGCCGE